MTPEELIEQAAEGSLHPIEGVDPATAKLVRGHLAVSDLVVVPIEAVGSFIGRGQDIELQDRSGTAIGTICFTRRFSQVSPTTLTRWQYAAYLAECEAAQIGLDYTFRRDYVVVDESAAGDYLDRYAPGAPLWGGFSHFPLPVRQSGPQPAQILGNPDIHLPTQYHKQAFTRYIEAKNAFDRFLKLYHTLELLFDYVVLKQMRQVGNDLQQFGKIMNEYERSEIERLKYLLMTFCDDPVEIADGFIPVSLHQNLAEAIFQIHGKSGNPLKDQSRWTDFVALAGAGTVSEVNLTSAKFVSRQMPYKNFVAGLAAYWIYRVRSSIAHSRVGEFVFVDSDENFITEFAEPLLLYVVNQVFENSGLKQLSAV